MILATQKPSGVVNDQIWSNTKFRVCLKVQDEADSKEMLKHVDAAHITRAGRYYLQVGYDEIYELGQSGWCGAKYYPSDEIVKDINNEVDFIDSCGNKTRSIEESKNIKIEAQGEQLGAVMKNIIEISKHENLVSRKLWLPNIPDVITLNYLYKKYNYKRLVGKYSVPVGEYDAPEEQKQGLVEYNFIENGNTVIYSTDNIDSEMMLESIIVSIFSWYKSSEVNIYGIDYGSEFTRKYQRAPHIGGIVYAGENEKFENLCKMISEEINNRKKLFNDYGGTFLNYIKSSGKQLPFILVLINNYDALLDEQGDMNEMLIDLTRDSTRYGMAFVVTASSSSSISMKASQNLGNVYAFKLKDQSDYGYLLNSKSKLIPKGNKGRGMLNNGDMHEFQVASIVEDEELYNEYIKKVIDAVCESQKIRAKAIPHLPTIVRKEDVVVEKVTLDKFPLGIGKEELNIFEYNFVENGNLQIISRKIKNNINFIHSLVDNIKSIEKSSYQFFDLTGSLKVDGIDMIKDDYDSHFKQLIEKLKKQEIKSPNITLLYGMNEVLEKCDMETFENLGELINNNPNAFLIGIYNADSREITYENAYEILFSNHSGLYIGKGVQEQPILKIDNYSRELEAPVTDDFGFYIQDGEYKILKLIDYYTEDDSDGK